MFATPIHDRYFEDYVPGAEYDFGSMRVDERRLIDFATEFDPQFIHTDVVAAADGPYGGLIASGWHTAAIMMRLVADAYLTSVASLGGPGVDELRWLRPVRPNDVLRLHVRTLDAKRSNSKPDRGVVRSTAELYNQDGEAVFRVTLINLIRLRHPDA
jgi:acyl dehydratase